MIDSGKWAIAVNATGVEESTLMGSYTQTERRRFGLVTNQLTIINTGAVKVYAKINSTVATVVAAVAAGEGAVPIEADGGAMTWRCADIRNVVLATAAGATTVDMATVAVE